MVLSLSASWLHGVCCLCCSLPGPQRRPTHAGGWERRNSNGWCGLAAVSPTTASGGSPGRRALCMRVDSDRVGDSDRDGGALSVACCMDVRSRAARDSNPAGGCSWPSAITA